MGEAMVLRNLDLHGNSDCMQNRAERYENI
jgi:hypothetical protein